MVMFLAADLAVLLDLTLARMILHIGLVSYQKTAKGREDANLEELQSLYAPAVKRLGALKRDEFVASDAPAVVPSLAPVVDRQSVVTSINSLMSRRQAVLGKTYTFYDEPLALVRGRGTRLYDAAGNEYLDCYNNVANVGHAHPYVVEALARQAATLNTNSRLSAHRGPAARRAAFGNAAERPLTPGFSSVPVQRRTISR